MNRKLEMHAIIDSIERDLINEICLILTVDNLSNVHINKIVSRYDGNDFFTMLTYLDLQDYIEIINTSIKSFHISNDEKTFINKQISKLIPIRNRVMHPRPLEFDDYPILKFTFSEIPSVLTSFGWENVRKVQDIIKNHPEELLSLQFRKDYYSSKIYENLPTPEFDDTSYIGRFKERADIKNLILSDRHYVVTIKGEGGNGKTATVLKTLYDMLDLPENPFEAIIWVTLKTEHLNDLEFTNIDNAIKEFDIMSKFIENAMITENDLSTVENIINFAKNFNTLLVLDNLETLNVNDVRDFILSFVEYGKILITSRIGLGEIERRYTLEPMNEKDSLQYFDALLQYYNLENLYSNNEKRNLVINELYKNPLTIKWFARSLTNGLTTNEILENKVDVINFCMKNVYEKLGQFAKDILFVCVIEDRELSYSSLTFLLGLEYSNEFNIRKGALQLDSSNFLDTNLLKVGKVRLTELSRNYLRTNHFPEKQFRDRILRNRKKLQDLKQEMEVKNITDRYNPKSIECSNNEEYLLSGWHLMKALEMSASGNFEKAFELCEIAKKISSDYFEPYKISAFLYGLKKDNRAENEYKIALSLAKSIIDKSTILTLYASYILERDDRNKALELIEEALSYDESSVHILLEKVKILTYLGRYDNAQEILFNIDVDNLRTLKYTNIFYTRLADTYKRRAESIEWRFFEGRFPLLIKAFESLEKSPKPDYQLTNMKIGILVEILNYHHNKEAVEFFVRKVTQYYDELYENSRFGRLYSSVTNKINNLPHEEYVSILKKMFQDFNKTAILIEDNDIGIITKLKDAYGFIKNKQHFKGIYFRVLNGDIYRVGMKVRFQINSDNNGRVSAKITEVLE
jgi:tetratricopeptide (TPR) repeat protein